MNEAFLHWIWKHKRLPLQPWKTTDGRDLEVEDFGFPHDHAGPDFRMARILLDGQLWAGNIEIHVRSSDWLRHGHQSDPAYNSVILHVVYECDTEVAGPDGSPIPTLQLKGLIDEYPLWRLEQLQARQDFVPCAPYLPQLEKEWLHTVWPLHFVKRMEERTQLVEEALKESAGDMEQAVFRLLLRAWMLPHNGEPAWQLGRLVSWKQLKRWENNPVRMEACLLGRAGLLSEPTGSSILETPFLKEWAVVKGLAGETAVEGSPWRYHRMRPPEFPDLRLVQFAAFLRSVPSLFSLVDEQQVPQMLPPSAYWETHYRWGREGEKKQRVPGKDLWVRLLVNALGPVHLYRHEDPEALLSLWEHLPAENNVVIRNFWKLGWRAENLAMGQALLQLHGRECRLKKCLNCAIGHRLIQG